MGRLNRLISGLRGEAAFAIIMMAAASLGFVKAIGIATVLPPAEFGRYISLLGIAMLMSIFCSLGRVEATIKLYPAYLMQLQGLTTSRHAVRLWVGQAWRIAAAAMLLAGIVMPGGLLARFGASVTILPQDIALVAVIAWFVTGLTIMASVVRAIPNIGLLQRYTVLRGALVLLVALPAAYLSQNWFLTLVAEGAGMVCVLIVSIVWVAPHLRTDEAITSDTVVLPEEINKGGGALYGAILANATIPYGGRSFVLMASGAATAGAFGLLTLILQVGVLLGGALTQKLGPRLIRDSVSKTLGLRPLLPPIALMAILAVGIFVFLQISYRVPFGQAFWDRYDIGPGILALISIQMMFLVHHFIRSFLIAQHRELDIAIATSIGAAMFYVGAIITLYTDIGLIGYMLSALGAEVTLFVLQAAAVLKGDSKSSKSKHGMHG